MYCDASCEKIYRNGLILNNNTIGLISDDKMKEVLTFDINFGDITKVGVWNSDSQNGF